MKDVKKFTDSSFGGNEEFRALEWCAHSPHCIADLTGQVMDELDEYFSTRGLTYLSGQRELLRDTVRLRAIFSGTFCTRLHIAALTAAMGNIKIVRALEHANEIAVRSVLLYQVAQLVRLGGFLNDKDNAAERLGVITRIGRLQSRS